MSDDKTYVDVEVDLAKEDNVEVDDKLLQQTSNKLMKKEI